MLLSDPLRNRETEARPAQVAAPRFVDPVEPFEYLRLVFESDTDAVVADTNNRVRTYDLQVELDGSRRGSVFRRVVEQDPQQSLQGVSISENPDLLFGSMFGAVTMERQVSPGHQLLPLFTDFLDGSG